MVTYNESLLRGAKILEDADIPNSYGEAFVLLEKVTGIDKMHYILEKDNKMPIDMDREYNELISMRKSHIPLQHITGEQDFIR